MVAKAELEIKAQITELNAGLQKTQQELKEIRVESTKTSKTLQKNVSGTNQALQKMTGLLTGILTIGAFVGLARRVIEVRTEFEKFEAMLKVALGSAQAANREFQKIQDFASQTPFAVQELTDSFVRLVNQGFRPTMEQMRAMGDLAAAMGKDFIQLTEAIIDAQVGEFERLKEFGIRASKQGDEVTLSFRGVERQVDFTADAIRDAVLEFGEMEGIMGSMAEVSKTLGGRISNLGDAWTTLLDIMGEKSSGVLTGVIGKLTDAVNALVWMQQQTEGMGEIYQGAIKDINNAMEGLTIEEKIDLATELLNDFNESSQEFNETSVEVAEKGLGRWTQLLPGVGALLKTYNKEVDESAEVHSGLAEEYKNVTDWLSLFISEQKILLEQSEGEDSVPGLIELTTKKIKDLREQIKKASSVDEIQRLNRELALLEGNLKRLTDPEKFEADLAPDIDWKATNKEANDAYKERVEFEEDLEKQKDDILDGLYERRIQRTDDELEQTKENQERERDLRQATTQQAFQTASALLGSLGELQRIRLEEDLKNAGENEAKKEQIIREFNKKQQTMAVAQTLIAGAEAIVRNSQQLGFVPAIPINILQAIQTATQLAVIKAQKFRHGGYEVLKGRRHHQGGIQIPIGEAEDGEGHAVFSREATKKFGKFIPAFVKQINEGNMPGNLLMMEHSVSLDDSDQLEEIKQLLQSREKAVHYDGKYKIIKAGNVITKVRS